MASSKKPWLEVPLEIRTRTYRYLFALRSQRPQIDLLLYNDTFESYAGSTSPGLGGELDIISPSIFRDPGILAVCWPVRIEALAELKRYFILRVQIHEGYKGSALGLWSPPFQKSSNSLFATMMNLYPKQAHLMNIVPFGIKPSFSSCLRYLYILYSVVEEVQWPDFSLLPGLEVVRFEWSEETIYVDIELDDVALWLENDDTEPFVLALREAVEQVFASDPRSDTSKILESGRFRSEWMSNFEITFRSEELKILESTANCFDWDSLNFLDDLDGGEVDFRDQAGSIRQIFENVVQEHNVSKAADVKEVLETMTGTVA